MRLLVLSDLHLEWSDLVLPDDMAIDVAVLAGDIACPSLDVDAWVRASPALWHARAVIRVDGNHEHYDDVLPRAPQPSPGALKAPGRPALHVLDCGQAVVDGVRFLGCTLWTDFELRIDTPDGPRSDREHGMAVAAQMMADYRAIGWADDVVPRRLTPQDTRVLHRRQRGWLEHRLAEPFDGPTVVVTHHGPHRGSLAPRFAADWVSTAYLSELPPQFFEVPVLWVHGHTHSSHDYRVGHCRVLCNPRGYQRPGMARPENPGFDPGLVVHLDVHASAQD
jgi:predicted phosphodiesterase